MTREIIAKSCQMVYIRHTNVSLRYAKDEEIVNEDVYLDNLPITANHILNVLWDKNVPMTTAELTEAVNERYKTQWKRKDIQKFVGALVNEEYVAAKRKGFRIYYHALGMEDALEYM